MKYKFAFFLLGLSLEVQAKSLILNTDVERFKFLPVRSEKLYGDYLRGTSDAPCIEPYTKYLAAWKAGRWESGPDGQSAWDLIFDVSQCLLENLTATDKQNMASALVLLGLTPILFSTLGPSLNELGLISLQRPFLSFLFSVATVVPYSSRALSSYDDGPGEILRRRRALGGGTSRWLRRQAELHGDWTLYAVGILEHLIAGAAVFNSVYTAWQLGVASLFMLASGFVIFPLLWILSSLIPHCINVAALYRVQRLDRRSRISTVTNGGGSTGTSSSTLGGIIHNSLVSTGEREYGTLALHLMPAPAHPTFRLQIFEHHWLPNLAHNVATVLSFLQILIGILIFSSLYFVCPADVAVIVLRFGTSVVVCRILIAFELGGMRTEEGNMKSEPEGIAMLGNTFDV